MNANDLRELGQQIARDIAAGLVAATAAGAKQFCQEMADAGRAAEADGLLALAERIEAEKAALAAQIEKATGLKRLALERRLGALAAAEERLCDEARPAQEVEAADGQPTHRRDGRRFARVPGLTVVSGRP
jgi:hypothetical protein